MFQTKAVDLNDDRFYVVNVYNLTVVYCGQLEKFELIIKYDL